MKFTAIQLEFLMTKLKVDDAFIKEAAAFKAKKVAKVATEGCCSTIKKDGNRCASKAKYDGKCGSHKDGERKLKKPAAKAVAKTAPKPSGQSTSSGKNYVDIVVDGEFVVDSDDSE